MNKLPSVLIAALTLSALPVSMAVAADRIVDRVLVGQIRGHVEVDYLSYTYSTGALNEFNDRLDFSEPLFANVLADFTVAAPAVGNVSASVVADVGFGWIQFKNLAAVAVNGVVPGFEVSGKGRFQVNTIVTETITIDAPGQTGSPGTALLGYIVDGVLSAGLGTHYEGRSGGSVEGATNIWVSIVADNTVSAGLSGSVSRFEAPQTLGFFDDFLGGSVNFTYGTPFDLQVGFSSEGFAGAASKANEDGGGLPAAATLVSDFGNTITWAGVANLRDSDGNAVTDFTAFSSNGTDFRYAISAPPAIPEPATVLLFAAGLAVLGAAFSKNGGARRGLARPPRRPTTALWPARAPAAQRSRSGSQCQTVK